MEKCEKLFERQNVHLGSFSCKDCEERFPLLSDLKKHKQKHHVKLNTEKAKTLFYDICQKGFSHKRDFKTHLSLHKNPDLFKCDHCSKKFSRTSDLRKHKMIV